MEPTYVNQYGVRVWENKDGVSHRLDGPAIVWPSGTMFWYINGKRHRTDGPAAIVKDWISNIQLGFHFFINGVNITRDVEKWIKENNYPEWFSESSWDDNIKMHFKMRFG